MKVLVLGATGMLGHMVVDYLSQDKDIELQATNRLQFNALSRDVTYQLERFKADWVVNCIGLTKPHIIEDDRFCLWEAVMANILLPFELANCEGKEIIQIESDCIYRGNNGWYKESTPSDATDVYGGTKSLGEVKSPNMRHLRCSIIGPELEDRKYSLLSKFLSGEIKQGYRDHLWNGITTLHFAKLCQGIIKNKVEPFHLQHIVPADTVCKADLLDMIAHSFGREDLKPEHVFMGKLVNRVLKTDDPEKNQMLWKLAGYEQPPIIEQMVMELAEYCRQRK